MLIHHNYLFTHHPCSSSPLLPVIVLTGALDKICGYGGDLKSNWRTVGARKQVLDIAEARKYPVGAREKMCATECDIYVHCFQV